ncbi:MAG: ABC-F family ATP-binding cassette domain-containing protein [Desulfobulbaceae bacterium]|nr:ABC-F family ATP-binding cassette domain-containing protein [Desulfobulbaceae bacterium]
MFMLISCQTISKAFGIQQLFNDISLTFSSDEKLGLIGPNGSGKSTLLKIMAGLETADTGKINIRKGTKIVYLAQEDIFGPEDTVETVLAAAIAEDPDDISRHNRVSMMISQTELGDPAQNVSSLSGGWRKRLAIARAFIQNPDILLLDEPTNHLDIHGILWLEKILQNAAFAFILISHDRAFLENTTNHIIELNRCYPDGFFRVSGNYSRFLDKRETFLENQQQVQSSLSNKVRREIEWLRRGPKARTTKAKFRIDKAHDLQNELTDVTARNQANKKVKIDFTATGRKTKKLLSVKNISKSLGGCELFSNLSFDLSPKSRFGLMGANGCGKTTLMHILADRLQPDTGEVVRVDGLRVVLFDQKREQINQQETLRQALSPAGDTVIFNDNPVHIVTWAKRFLFSPDQLEQPVSRLSGGEQARILIARLMLMPADILLLDEPGNDLDIPSLSILEESLMEFSGAVVLVSHDRFFLDKVTTQILGFHGDGRSCMYAGFDQWLNEQTPKAPPVKKSPKKEKPKKAGAYKITYKERLELAAIEETILAAEEELQKCQEQIEDPAVIENAEELAKWCQLLQPAQEKVEALYARWEELEARNQ